MSLKKDFLQLTSIFVILIIFLIFPGYFILQGVYLYSAILFGPLIPLFILMVMKGRSMKEKYPEEYE